MTTTSKRLAILENSLSKKQDAFNSRLEAHFADVRSANGQPINDKRNGRAIAARWEKQNETLRSLQKGIEKTVAAIEREKDKIDSVNSVDLPPALVAAIEAGELVQWRRHPNTFFVPGVDRGRIVWKEDEKVLAYRYLSEVPKEHYAKFRDTYNRLRKAV